VRKSEVVKEVEIAKYYVDHLKYKLNVGCRRRGSGATSRKRNSAMKVSFGFTRGDRSYPCLALIVVLRLSSQLCAECATVTVC